MFRIISSRIKTLVCGTFPNLTNALSLEILLCDLIDNCTVKYSVPSFEIRSAIMGMSTVADMLFAVKFAVK